MPHRFCPRHGTDHPCTCAMGNLYRFVEPVVLMLLLEKQRSHGYELASEVQTHALTDAAIEVAALYRTLRQLERNGCVQSEWDIDHGGPARRMYRLTAKGEAHLKEWTVVLQHMAGSMQQFVAEARQCGIASTRSEAVGAHPEHLPEVLSKVHTGSNKLL